MTVPDRCRPRLLVAQGWQRARLLTVRDEPRRGRAPRCSRVSARGDACPGQGRRGTHRTRSLAGPRGRGRPPGGRSAVHTPSPAPCVTDRWLGPAPRGSRSDPWGVTWRHARARGGAERGCTWQAHTYLSWSPGGWWLQGEQGLRGHRHPPKPPTSVSLGFSHPGWPSPRGRHAQCA